MITDAKLQTRVRSFPLVSQMIGQGIEMLHRGAKVIGILALGMTCGLERDSTAHDQIPGAPQSGPIAIVGATIHPVSGPEIKSATILFDQGKIVAVGTNVEIPAEATRIEGAGKHVYPGLIESHTDLGLREIEAVDVTIDSQETGDQNANVRSWVAVNPDSELIPVARANGVLSALIVPSGQAICGQAGVLALDGWTARDMALRAPAGLCVMWEGMEPRGESGADPKAREDRFAELDALLDSAIRYEAARLANPQETPTNVRLESLLPMIHGEIPLIAEANRQRAIESAVAYAVKRGLKLVIAGGYDAERCASLLKQYDVPVIITGTYRLPRYRTDAYDASYTLPERLRAAGVKFCICGNSGDASNVRNLPYHAGNAVAYGLPLDDAVRAITLSAAEILGVADQIGSLEAGKLATLVVTTGVILESDTQIIAAYISGAEVDLSSRHTQLYDKYRTKYERLKP